MGRCLLYVYTVLVRRKASASTNSDVRRTSRIIASGRILHVNFSPSVSQPSSAPTSVPTLRLQECTSNCPNIGSITSDLPMRCFKSSIRSKWAYLPYLPLPHLQSHLKSHYDRATWFRLDWVEQIANLSVLTWSRCAAPWSSTTM